MTKSIVIAERDNIAAVLENNRVMEFFVHRGDILCQWAKYEIKSLEPLSKNEDLLYIKNRIDSSENLFISKKNKKGIEKQLDIKQSIKSVQLQDDKLYMILKTGQGGDVPSLRADVALATILPDKFFDITRVEFYDKDFKKI